MPKKPSSSLSVYTYRCGERIELKKRPDQFVVRRLPDDLPSDLIRRISSLEKSSSSSARVTCGSGDLEALMAESRELAPTHHAYETIDDGSDFLVSDRVIVSFVDVLGVEQEGAFAGKYALETVRRISSKDVLYRLTNNTGMNPLKLVVKLTEKEEFVANADLDLNMMARKSVFKLPTDSSYRRQWHLHRRMEESNSYDKRSSSRCEEAWQLLGGFGDSDIVVGVTDDGCQLDHPDFNTSDKFAGWAYFPDRTLRLVREGDPGADPKKMYVSGQDHGTACAGVIAAENDGRRTVGAAPACRLLPVRWHSEGPRLFISDSKLLTVLDYLGDKVDVLSNSWGVTPQSTWGQVVLNRIDQLAISGGRSGQGIVFLWAAGNENCPISHISNQEIPYTNGWDRFGWSGVRTSKKFSNNLVNRSGVMHVAALASTAQRSHYSNYGTGIDLCAPSSNSHAYWRLDLPGIGITTTEGTDRVVDDFGGTSSATPLVAGVAALVLSANRILNAAEVVSLLKRTCSKDLSMIGWPKTPPSPADPDPSWDVSPVAPFDSGEFVSSIEGEGSWSPWFGFGKVDAVAAVREALVNERLKTVRVHASKTEDLTIPDNDPAGVISRLFVTEKGQLRALKVNVDISHSWIGDLIVSLIGPSGQKAILHERSGSGTHNIVVGFDDASAPELSQFYGQDVRGVWSLEVSDNAERDSGVLRRWGVEAEILATDNARYQSTASLAIPDDNLDGVSDCIHVSDSKILSNIAVEVDITHSWIGDLEVKLTDPGGRHVLLHNRSGEKGDNIQKSYTIENVNDLSNMIGNAVRGDWTLTVVDHAQQDVGKLNRWALFLD